ncbi:MAG: hypothetical protein H0U49_11080, partial [Parachlamydiaceae bacterium]|nr:hypothetical protein [Parachlamydiaceae bacterium]
MNNYFRAVISFCSFILSLGFITIAQSLEAVNIQTLVDGLHRGQPPFTYPLDIKVFKGKSTDEEVILCCHGFGGDSSIASVVASYQIVPAHLVGFNFPDYNITARNLSPSQVSYGSIDELLPAIYLLKKMAVEAQANKISLYGFSMGGGAVVNIIAVLNTSQNDQRLNSIGVSREDKQKILAALQKGVILLDAPLKSMEEYNAAHPAYQENPLNVWQTKRYRENGMRPIDALAKWQGLNLSVVLFFQNPDESLSNRDDALYMEKLLQANPKGRNMLLSGSEGGHLGFHTSLWKAYLT